MYNEIIKGKKTEYNPPLFLRIKGKLYYSYIISIPPTDFTNNQKRILSFFIPINSVIYLDFILLQKIKILLYIIILEIIKKIVLLNFINYIKMILQMILLKFIFKNDLK